MKENKSHGQKALELMNEIICAYENGSFRSDGDIEYIFNVYWSNIELVENGKILIENLISAQNKLLDIVFRKGGRGNG